MLNIMSQHQNGQLHSPNGAGMSKSIPMLLNCQLQSFLIPVLRPLHHEQQTPGNIPDFALFNIQPLLDLTQSQDGIQAKHPHHVGFTTKGMQSKPAAISQHHDWLIAVPFPRSDLCSEDCCNHLLCASRLFLHHSMEALQEDTSMTVCPW